MRAAGNGRIINISSVLGLVPAPYMASYAATKHAIEGYSESVDHEVREHGIRVLLVEPAYTRTGFDAKAIQPDAPLPIYAEQRNVFDGVMVRAMADGDDPAIRRHGDRRGRHGSEAEAALHRRPDRRTRQRPASLRPRAGLRSADPKAQPSAA